MPELPEVEAARALLQQYCIGKRISKAVVQNDTKVIDGIQPGDLQAALEGRVPSEACRKGKQLWINFDEGPSLLLHLGMTGRVEVKGKESLKYMLAKAVNIDEWPPKYCKLEVALSDNTCMAFCDSRRFGRVKFLEGPAIKGCLPSGWDALDDEPTVAQLAARLAKKHVPVKSLLLDQAIYAGIGNWCADEILLEARIHPKELACDLDTEQLTMLRSSIRSIMSTAVGCGAESFRYPQHWIFHHRWAPKKAPPHLSFLKIGGRSTALDEAQQILMGPNRRPPNSGAGCDTSLTKSARTDPQKAGTKRAAPYERKPPEGKAEPHSSTVTEEFRKVSRPRIM